ncbi:lipopolysaccharide assembly protein LapB [Streptomyces sp. NBC_00568]|uniref:tetratricopeptide repeat protein n=1 Tax=Streptomyces sp. NBC_00568 TaxID=2975779 RepID=UPI0022544246|nr:tetratricopeptide repeat protein [Streptomyces sp. NBC_00568]MCX4990618.1 tetratricopeptide repeat protein [Streptomyces sp. NBC_00568]
MEIEQRQPVPAGSGPAEPVGPQPPEPSGPRRSPLTRRALIGAVAGCAALGGLLVLLPSLGRDGAARPAPGPVARAVTAVGSGVPAALPDLEALIDDHESHLRAHPRDDRSWAVLGVAYTEQARRTAAAAYYPRAEKALRTSLRVRPKANAEALDGLAGLAAARRDFRAAKEWGEAAVKLAPKRWTAYPSLIDAYTGLGDHKATSRALDKLLGLRSGPAAQAVASRVFRDRGRREDAAAAISDAAAGAATPSERAVFLQQAGDLAWERGDLKESLDYYRAAVNTDADEHGALAGQGRALAALGRTSEALRAYRAALAKRPAPRYALELGELYEKVGLGGAAREQYDLVRELVQRDASAGVDDELVLGVFEADHGDPQAAVRTLRVEWRRHPGIAVADALGWALHRSGDDAEALKFAERAMDKEHGGEVRSALYAYHRGQIERDLRRSGPARRHLAEALRINPHFSPLLAPAAREALAALGEPPATGLPEPSEESDGSEESGPSGESGESGESDESAGATGAAGAPGTAGSPGSGSPGPAAPSTAPGRPSAPASRPSAAR